MYAFIAVSKDRVALCKRVKISTSSWAFGSFSALSNRLARLASLAVSSTFFWPLAVSIFTCSSVNPRHSIELATSASGGSIFFSTTPPVFTPGSSNTSLVLLATTAPNCSSRLSALDTCLPSLLSLARWDGGSVALSLVSSPPSSMPNSSSSDFRDAKSPSSSSVSSGCGVGGLPASCSAVSSSTNATGLSSGAGLGLGAGATDSSAARKSGIAPASTYFLNASLCRIVSLRLLLSVDAGNASSSAADLTPKTASTDFLPTPLSWFSSASSSTRAASRSVCRCLACATPSSVRPTASSLRSAVHAPPV